MSGDSSDQLPDNWLWTTMREVADINMGQSPPSSSYNEEKIGLPFYQGKTDFGSLSPSPRVWCSLPSKTADAGDILISVRAPVGPTNLCAEKSCIGRGLAAIRPRLEMPSLFFLFYLRSIEKSISQMGVGTTFAAVKRSDLESIPFPLAPLAEQRRIVAKVESLFAESKTAREALDKVPVLLRRFRQSILAKAFKGELTQRDPNDEPAQKLLERIKQERQKGKQIKLVEIEEPEVDELPLLPETWCWTTIGVVAEVQMGQSPPGSSYNQSGQGVPLLNGPTEFGREHPAPTQWTTMPTKICHKGDLLICVRGNTTGRMNWADQEYCIGRGLAAISSVSDLVNNKSLFYFLLKETEEVMRRTTGSTFPNLQSNELRKIPFPLTPSQEQKRLVAKIEECFSLADSIEAAVKKARERLDLIDQVVLAKAFRGELVPQDPTDESASSLLQCIRATTGQHTSIQKKLPV